MNRSAGLLAPAPAAGSGAVDHRQQAGQPPAGAYKLLILKRIKVGPLKLKVGQVLDVSPARLAVVAFLIRNGAARAWDRRTATDAEVFEFFNRTAT